ncbi:MAG: hypothetical protein ABF811_03320 [Pseudoclavibacter sp.]
MAETDSIFNRGMMGDVVRIDSPGLGPGPQHIRLERHQEIKANFHMKSVLSETMAELAR